MCSQLVPRLARVLMLLVLVLVPEFAGAAAPKDIVLMLDNSGSMQKNDPKHLTKIAVRTFLETLSGDTDVAVVIFDQGVRVSMPLTPLNEQTRPKFLRSLDSINFKGLLTDSPAALERAIYELKVKGRAGAEKSIVFMTDGIVDTGDKARDADKIRWMREELAPAAAEAGIRIFAIAFTENADFELIQSLARRTRGAYYRAFAARDIDGVFDDIVRIFDQPSVPARVPASQDLSAAAQPATPDTTANLPPVEPVTEPPAGGPAIETPAAEPSNEMQLPDSTPPDEALPAEPPSEGGLPALPPAAEPTSITSVPDARIPDQTPPATEDASTEQPTTSTSASASASASASPPAPNAVAPDTANTGAGPDVGAQRGTLDELGYTLLLAAAALFAVVVVGFTAFVVRRKLTARKAHGPNTPKAFLNDLRGITDQPSYELTDKVTVIGRIKGTDAEHCDYIVIDEPTIGRRHSIIEYKDHAYWVTDQSSINGTYVNNERIEGGVRLKHGDRIRFHKHEFEFLLLDMFETDRTMVSATMFAAVPNATGHHSEDGDRTQRRARADVTRSPTDADPTER